MPCVASRRDALLLCLCLLLAPCCLADSPAIALSGLDRTRVLSHEVSYFMEDSGRLSLRAASVRYEAGHFSPLGRSTPSFGLNSEPIWLHFRLDRDKAALQAPALLLPTAWLDQVELYVCAPECQGSAWPDQQVVTGDAYPFRQRPEEQIGFHFPLQLQPGFNDIFLRVATPDPMMVPLLLMPASAVQAHYRLEYYSYAFLYGFLAALMCYSLIMFLVLRDWKNLSYALFLAGFIIMNLAYTGHGYQWLWPDSPTFQQWSSPLFMIVFGSTGIFFVTSFLELRRTLPVVNTLLIAMVLVTVAFFLLSFALASKVAGLYTAFIFVAVFCCILLAIIVLAACRDFRSQPFFIIASAMGIIGAAITLMTVWGVVPYTLAGFRAVELGMVVEALFFGIALAVRLRLAEKARQEAWILSETDALTGLHNRRAFYREAPHLLAQAEQHYSAFCLVLVDLDYFKQVNDDYGHAFGDRVLRQLAVTLRQYTRQQDFVARWGGEEFLLILNHTRLDTGVLLAERLRKAVHAIRVEEEPEHPPLSASFGLAESAPGMDLSQLLQRADEALYHAKASGRDQVAIWSEQLSGTVQLKQPL